MGPYDRPYLDQAEEQALAENPYQRPQLPTQWPTGGLTSQPAPNLGGGQDAMATQAGMAGDQSNAAGMQALAQQLAGSQKGGGGGLMQGISSLLPLLAML